MDLAKIELAPEDPSRNRDPFALIRPHEPVPGVYGPLIRALQERDPHAYSYVYDWRVDIRISAQRLARFVEHILGKVRGDLGESAPRSVILIGHSMGGLVIKWYATQILERKATIARIITIGTPHRGSMQVVEGLMLAPKNPLIWEFLNQKRLRIAQRTMPSVYQMLPRWPGAVVPADNPDANPGIDLYEAENWPRDFLREMARELSSRFFPRMLAQGREVSELLACPYPPPLTDRLCLAVGEGTRTPCQIQVERDGDAGHRFRLRSLPSDRFGDGVVHQISSKIPAAQIHVAPKQPSDNFRLLGQHVGMVKHRRLIQWVLRMVRETAEDSGGA